MFTNGFYLSFKKKYIVKFLERYKKISNFVTQHGGTRVTSELEEIFTLYNYQLHINELNQPSSSMLNVRYECSNIYIISIIKHYYTIYTLIFFL
jgi:hypothetical protein